MGGASKSRDLNNIRQEAAALIKNGYKEVVLTGVCLGSYGRDLVPKLSLIDVIQSLDEIPGNFRVRLSSILPGLSTGGWSHSPTTRSPHTAQSVLLTSMRSTL